MLTPRGQIRIENTFQLKGHDNIYAIGDVIDWQEQKQAAKAPKHAQIAAANILSQISGGPAKKSYTSQTELIIVTNGKVRCCSSHSSPFAHLLTTCHVIAEVRHLIYGHALGHHTGQLVL